MADITMCKDKDCDLKKDCHRYLAKPSYRQSYFDGSPVEKGEPCLYYWPIDSRRLTNMSTRRYGSKEAITIEEKGQ